MFNDGISVPGLTLLYLFNDLPPITFFTVFNQTNKDLHHLVKDNIVGGAVIIFHLYHENNVTKIRADPDKAVIADTMKLPGNLGCGKTVTTTYQWRYGNV